MSGRYSNEPMLEMFIFETSQLLEQLEQLILSSEKSSCFTQAAIGEIFRIMHTIKGSSAMMRFNNISSLSHSIEDLFFFLREDKPGNVDCSRISDLVFEGLDFVKVELEKIKNGDSADGDALELIENIKSCLGALKLTNRTSGTPDFQGDSDRKAFLSPYTAVDGNASMNGARTFKALLRFEEGCEMENIRAYAVVHNLKDIAEDIGHIPEDIINDLAAEEIRRRGLTLFIRTDRTYEEVHQNLMQAVFLERLELEEQETENGSEGLPRKQQDSVEEEPVKMQLPGDRAYSQQSIISVNVAKLDKLMDLVGELVISEAMVTQNPDLKGLHLDNFQKSARQLKKITGELQDMVMSIRMVPIAQTFQKVNRIIRDMSKKLNKEVQLQIQGEETEVDKNIVEHISDPLMHIIRNSIDHGIEDPEERLAAGKPETGTVMLEARNSGNDVLVTVRDDGRGLDKNKILKTAKDNGLLHKAEDEFTDKEIYSLIFLPGFSTKENITEFSGRGVGMDVVTKNIQAVGGSVSVDSSPGEGTTITLKLPLTLAIIDGMTVRTGKSRYTIPTASIKESFRAAEKDLITDPDGREMMMVRGQCYPVMRLHRIFNVQSAVRVMEEGIIVMVESESRTFCLFTDELLGEQQVVVKPLPNYIRNTRKIKGLSGCTLLGDGSISLILDIAGISHFL